MSVPEFPRYARPLVLDQLTSDGHHVIEASAGTGKTFTLEHLVVDRVLQGVDLTKILVVTFTDRAAAELRTRIRALLWRLVVAAREPAKPVPDPAWTLDDDAVKRLLAALSRIDAATISTIHAFCQRLLTENAFAHRRLFSQRLTDGKELFSAVFRDFLRRALKSDADFELLLRPHLGTGLDEDGAMLEIEKGLYQVVRFHGELEPVLEEDVVVKALAWLPKTLPTGAAIAAAYKGRMKRELIAEVLQLVLDALAQARTSTGARRWLALGALLDKGGRTEKRIDYALKALETTDLGAAATLLETLRALRARIPDAESLLARLYREPLRAALRERKEEQGLFDYDDMLEVVEASLHGEAAEAVKASLRERFSFVLIDEFQDTDPVQWRVFHRLFAEPGSTTSLAVIGDPKQAIYGFRAADVETYLEARQALINEPDEERFEARIVRLTQNFRSSERMIAAYNLILRQASPAEHTFFQADERIAYGPRSEVSCGEPRGRLVDAGGTELEPVHLVQVPLVKSKAKASTVAPVAAFIAAEVARLLGPGGPRLVDASHPAGRSLTARDIYVLSRSGPDSQKVAIELGLRGVPFSFYKLSGLFQTEEVVDLLDVLEAVLEPFDRVRRARAWLTPFFELTPAEVEAALEVSDEHPLVQRLRDWHEHGNRRDYRRLFTALIEDSGLARRAALFPQGERPLTNVQRVLDLLAEESRRRHATLVELVDLLRSWQAGRAQPSQQDADVQPLETERPAVQLMTMHAAKGLEAPVVFLLGGTSAPPNNALHVFHRQSARKGWLGSPPGEIEQLVERETRGEDERLLYVALTRARLRLYLPWFVDGEGESVELEGPYQVLNARLGQLASTSFDPRHFAVVKVSPATGDDGGETRAPTSEWKTPEGLAFDPKLEGARYSLARARRGSLVTSYSQLAARTARLAPTEVDREETTGETNYAQTDPNELVTSNVVGNFLHDALEVLDLPRVKAFASGEAFMKDEAVHQLVESLADGAGIAPDQRPHAYRLLFAALRSPLHLGDEGVVPGVASLPRVLRESEFLFPIPERGQRLLGEQPRDEHAPFFVDRGLVKGFIDVVFEHHGRLYFGDWKSSVLRDASPEALHAYVTSHFHWQVVVYGVAVLRLLGIRDEATFEKKFGGFLYFFLREMEKTPEGEPTRGVWFERPTWQVVQGWERDLLEHDFGRREVGS